MSGQRESARLKYSVEELVSREGLEGTASPTDGADEAIDDAYDESELNTSLALEKDVSEYISREREYQLYPGAEMADYDFTAERHDMYNTNLAESTAHIMKGCLGAGILCMHEAFMYGGLWTSLIGTFVIGAVVSYAMYMLVKSAQIMYIKLRISRLSYADLAEVSIGSCPWKKIRKLSKYFRYSVDFCLFLEMCGTCSIYQIIIANTFKQVVDRLYPDVASHFEDMRICILIVTVPLLLLCMIRHLKFLAPFSMIADLIIAICVVTTLYYSVEKTDNISGRPAWKNYSGLLLFCGICMYSVNGLGVCLPIENNMRRPKYFPMVLQTAMVLVITLTALTGFFGYASWGEECRSPLTVHMPLHAFTTILQILLAIMLCVTFAVQFWVPFRIVWRYVGRRYKRKHRIWERFYRITLVFAISAVGLAFPDLVMIIVFVGNFFIGLIAFVFPAIIETSVTWTHHRIGKIRWILYKNLLMMMVGVVLACSTMYMFF